MKRELTLAKKQDSTSNLMTVLIMERTDNGYVFKKEKRRFGLVKENRPIKKTDVNGFLQIIQNGEYDDTQSIVTVEAIEIVEEYNIVDLEGNPISKDKANDYLIVLDGQHRITAFSKLNAIRDEENQIMIPNVHIKKEIQCIGKYLAEINMVGHSWNKADKVCVSAVSTGNRILEKVNELIKNGYNASTAMLICIGKDIKPNQLAKMISTGDISLLPDNEEEAIKRAEKFVNAVMEIEGMTTTLLTKRFYIKGFNAFAYSRNDNEAFNALDNLTIDNFRDIREDNEFTVQLRDAFLKSPNH